MTTSVAHFTIFYAMLVLNSWIVFAAYVLCILIYPYISMYILRVYHTRLIKSQLAHEVVLVNAKVAPSVIPRLAPASAFPEISRHV